MFRSVSAALGAAIVAGALATSQPASAAARTTSLSPAANWAPAATARSTPAR